MRYIKEKKVISKTRGVVNIDVRFSRSIDLTSERITRIDLNVSASALLVIHSYFAPSPKVEQAAVSPKDRITRWSLLKLPLSTPHKKPRVQAYLGV